MHVDLLTHTLSNVAGLKILDLGCGTGRVSRELARRGAEVTGVDFSAKAIEIARSLTSETNPVYQKASIYDIDFEEHFDVVIMFGVACVACSNDNEVSRVLHRILRVVKPDGKVLFFEPLHRGFLRRVLKMDVAEFAFIMKKAGFDVQEIRNMHFWPIHLVLASFPWHRLVTACGYYFGQFILTLLRHRAMGDYKFILALKPNRELRRRPLRNHSG